MDQPGIAVKRKNDRFVFGKKRIEVVVGQAVWMLARRLQFHQIDNVNNSDLEFR